MKLKVTALCSDLLDIGADRGNEMCLKYRCEKRGIVFEKTDCYSGEALPEETDLIYMGTGSDLKLKQALTDLRKIALPLKKLISDGAVCFFSMDSAMLLAEKTAFYEPEYADGLGIIAADFIREADKKAPAYTVTGVDLDGEKIEIAGFKNNRFCIKILKSPLGNVKLSEDKTLEYEGFMSERVIATGLSGPLLPKNPEFADYLIKKSLEKNYGKQILAPLDDELELKAKREMISLINK